MTWGPPGPLVRLGMYYPIMPPKGWKKNPPRGIERHLRPRPGLVDVGNKMTDHVRIAPNVYGKKRKPLHEETQ